MTETEKIPVLAVVGPTASGKTALGVMLSQLYGGEVVSADSMQIYTGLDIATAKPSSEEQQGVPHHLIGFVPMDTAFSVADYLTLAKPLIEQIHGRKHLPVIVGGTGLYVSSLLSNVQLAPTKQDPVLRQELLAYASAHGNKALHARLEQLDPLAAADIHPNNLVRVVRALEVCMTTGKTFTECKVESHRLPSPYHSLQIGLTFADRALLYERINARVDQMVQNGLVEEAYAVYQNEALRTAYHAIGYKELIPYFEKTMSFDECIDKIKQETRRYAKRQLTWFRKNSAIQWIIIDKFDKKQEILEKCQKIIAKSDLMCYNIE
ncbi:tRNA (adenosine(37)-N6)-dimethylallyltransferase MiaA [Ruminococcus sp.]|uniref:tRNA (adenosine(37)-N6)-dimethylallyltransferase MiaA n=1 Tax=Ruminococcus sp. TaxID=41978 RepID=UPI0025CBA201|nr:tRNA (adenosine(37)-N6)-dimethylallyltransferase MiaA [Ruminococcus sp.]